MKEWFTCAELAAMRLPNFPTTESGVKRWFKNREYDLRYPKKIRRRAGRGGGFEHHVSLLPQHIQTTLTVRAIKEAQEPGQPEVFVVALQVPEPVANEAGELKRDAILLLLSFWNVFRLNFSGAEETARHYFCTLYRNQKIQNFPGWARTALTSSTGNQIGVAVNTLRNWEQRRDIGDYAGLAGRYGNRKGKGVLDVAEDGKVAEHIAAMILSNPMVTAEHAKDDVEKVFGALLSCNGQPKPLPDLRTFQRWIKKWVAEHEEAIEKETNPDGFKNKRRVSGSNMNGWVTRPNQLWEIDASPADVLLTDGRYSIYVVIDIYTRRMMALVSKTPTTEAVLGLMRRAILDWGVPEILRTDNGSDFTSHRFVNAIQSLAIQIDVTTPFSPEQKGTVERGIGTIQRGLMRLEPGFIGHNVSDRKQIEARKSFAERLGESDKNAFCIELTAEQLQADLDSWLENKYAHRKHGTLKCSPFEKLASYTGAVRRIESERALDLLLAPIVGNDGLKKVSKQGIRHDKAFFLHRDLPVGDWVFCRTDSADMGRIYVYTADAKEFICVAECPNRVGVNPGDAVRAMREGQAERIKEELDPLKKQIRNTKPRDYIERALSLHEGKAASVTSFPQRSESHTTPELDAAAEDSRGPQIQEATSMGPQEVAAQQQMVADLAAERQKRTKPETDRDRFRRALDLQRAIDGDEVVSTDELKWLVGYQRTPEFEAMKEAYDDFGDRLFI